MNLDIPVTVYKHVEATSKGHNKLSRAQREKRKSMDSMRSKSNLNKDLDLVEVSKAYAFDPNEPKPYQWHNEYPPQNIRKLINNHKNRNQQNTGNLEPSV